MNRLLLPALVGLFAWTSVAAAGAPSRRTRAPREVHPALAITAETGGALVLGAVGTLAGLVAAEVVLTSSGQVGAIGLVVPVAGCALGCAGGASIVGSWLHQEGSFGWSLVGATAGTALGGCVLLGAVFSSSDPGPLWGAIVVLPPAGAALGYHLSRPSRETSAYLGGRLGLPAVALTSRAGLNGTRTPAVDFRLVNARF